MSAALKRRRDAATVALKPPPSLDLIEWADTYRRVAAKTSALPGRWSTRAQPVAFGPMAAVTEPDTHTVTVMAATQVLKTELLINVAAYFVHQDPSPILLVQPTQTAAESFSKERFAPTVEATPELRALIEPPRSRDAGNTITAKDYPGGSLHFVGANSPTDLASRPKRIILCDEIDKFPPSAGAEGDPMKLAEERASTYANVGRAKFVRCCSPTVEGVSRIGREYEASDRRQCFVPCPHCGDAQPLTWASVHWSRDEAGNHLPQTAGIVCGSCGTHWTEAERLSALAALEGEPGYGWRQTRPFTCCGVTRAPSEWDDQGRAVCPNCHRRAPYAGHAGFHASKLLSTRHKLSDVVAEFLGAKSDPELLRKWTNTGLAELWRPHAVETVDGANLIERAENYGPDDLPDEVQVITGFADVQGDRLEVQLIGWGADEEAWPFLFEVILQDPAQRAAWVELDALTKRMFKTRGGRPLRISAFGIDTGGHHGAQVHAFCRARRGRRIFACKGQGGQGRPIWPTRSSRSKTSDVLWIIGVDSAKDAIYGRLKIAKPGPGYIHFPSDDAFGQSYFEQLTSERRETRKQNGLPRVVWTLPSGRRNEALDTFVGALAVRRSLPRAIERGLEYGLPQTAPADPAAQSPAPPAPRMHPAADHGENRHLSNDWLSAPEGWL